MRISFTQSALSKLPKDRALVKSFTLTELLVVFAIFLILVSLLQPALLRTMRTAEKLTCLNKLKSIANATMVYCGDYNDFFPRAGMGGGRVYEDWHIGQVYGGDVNTSSLKPEYGALVKYYGLPTTLTAANRDAVRKQIHDNYRCPSDDNPIADPTGFPYEPSYALNEFIGGCREHTGSPGHHFRAQNTQVNLPSEKLLYIDKIPFDAVGFSVPLMGGNNWMSKRHFDGTESNDTGPGLGNASFADGHAREIDRTWLRLAKHYDPK